MPDTSRNRVRVLAFQDGDILLWDTSRAGCKQVLRRARIVDFNPAHASLKAGPPGR
jgi:hypothetical protein